MRSTVIRSEPPNPNIVLEERKEHQKQKGLTILESMMALAMNLPRKRNLERCLASGPAFMLRAQANGKRPAGLCT